MKSIPESFEELLLLIERIDKDKKSVFMYQCLIEEEMTGNYQFTVGVTATVLLALDLITEEEFTSLFK